MNRTGNTLAANLTGKGMENTLNPRDILVKDNITFRRWCHSMHLNAEQAGATLNISPQMIYKYIQADPKKSANIPGPILFLCELISKMQAEERREWVTYKISERNIPTRWPAENPLSAH